jgi:hypothetical protein
VNALESHKLTFLSSEAENIRFVETFDVSIRLIVDLCALTFDRTRIDVVSERTKELSETDDTTRFPSNIRSTSKTYSPLSVELSSFVDIRWEKVVNEVPLNLKGDIIIF